MEILGSNLFVLIGAVILGYVIGMIDSRITAKIRKPKEEEPKIQIVEKVVEVEKLVEAPSVFSVNFDGNRPVVKLDGQEVEYYDFSHEQRKRLIDILTYIRPWIDARMAPPRSQGQPQAQSAAPQSRPAAPSVPSQEQRPAATATPSTQSIRTPSPEEQQSTLQGRLAAHQTQITPVPEEPKVEPFSMNVISSARYMIQRRDKPEDRMLSIVEQIDEVVQNRLPTSPFVDMDISIKESPTGGVLIKVEDKIYQGVDNIADPEIQSFIRDCIARWEKATDKR